MANIHIAESTLSSIAEAIREKWWLAGSMHVSEMVGWLTSIKSTGDYRNIKNSSYLTFPELKSINTMSMFGENLISISLPNCSYIGSYAFYSCAKLTNSNIQDILNTYKSYSTVLNSVVFAYCSGITSLDLTGYTSIGNSAFAGCTNLSYISVPNCSYIGSNAFYGCTKLESIYIIYIYTNSK